MLKSKASWALSRPGGRWTYNRGINVPSYSTAKNIIKIKYSSSSNLYDFLGIDSSSDTVSRYISTADLTNWTSITSVVDFIGKDFARGPSNRIVVGTGTLPGFQHNIASIVGFTVTKSSVAPYTAGVVEYWSARSRFVHMSSTSSIRYGSTTPTTAAGSPGFSTPTAIAVRNGSFPLCVSAWNTYEELILNVGSNGTSYVDDYSTYIDLSGQNASPAGLIYSSAQNKFYWIYTQSPANQLVITTKEYSAPTTSLNFEAERVVTLPSIPPTTVKSVNLCDSAGVIFLLLTTGQILTTLDFGATWGLILTLSSDYSDLAFGPSGLVVATTPQNFITSP